MGSASLSLAKPDYDLIYGYESGMRAYSDVQPVLVGVSREIVDIFHDWGLPAICAVDDKWSRAHAELVEGWELVFTFGSKAWRQRVSRVVDGYVRGTFAVDVSAYDDIGHYIRCDQTGDDLYSLACSAPAYEFREEIGVSSRRISATPYEWIDPSKLPQREWLYGTHLLRKYVSVTVAPGGVGKSRLLTGEAVSMASGKNLFDTWSRPGLKVWLWNLEDDRDELARCIQAACKRHGVAPRDIQDNLFMDSGRDRELCTATVSRSGAEILEPVYDGVTLALKEMGIDVLIVDPFVSSHRVSENDNGMVDAVVKRWARVANDTNCAIELIHHCRKEGGGEITADSARGGGAIVSAARDVRVLNRMTDAQAEEFGVENARQYFTVGSDKSNFAPVDARQWYHIESVNLLNDFSGVAGDSVGVAMRWTPPNMMDAITPEMQAAALDRIRLGDCKYSPQATDWAGGFIADTLNLNASDKSDKSKLKRILGSWEYEGLIAKTFKSCPKKREPRPYYEVVE